MKKLLGVDAIKALGAFMVIGLHFFLNTNYYDMTINTPIMLIESFVKWFMLSAVAMFILTTGYLQSTKQPNKKYFKKLLPIIISYLCISLIAMFFRILRGESFTIISFIISFTTFDAGRYAWYVNMFIGLYLMLPFLNIMIKNMTKKEYQLFLAILVFLISFPDTIFKIFPDFWKSAYPLLFYFIGAYIRKYQVTYPKVRICIIILIMLVLQCGLSVLMSKLGQSQFLWTNITTIFMVTQTTSIFILLYQWNPNKVSWSTKLITMISPLTLEILLFSGITDNYVYDIVNQYPQIQVFTYAYIPLVLTIFTMLVIISYLYKQCFNAIISKIPYLSD